MVAATLSAAMVKNDDQGSVRLVKRGTNNTARDDVAAVGPELVTGDGALGFWKALRQVYGAAREQRCWVHKTGNILNKLPKGLQNKAKGAVAARMKRRWKGLRAVIPDPLHRKRPTTVLSSPARFGGAVPDPEHAYDCLSTSRARLWLLVS